MIYYSPDYKSEPDLPDDFGLMEVACSDGQHRFLSDALRCGCLKTINPQSERKRLEREVIEAGKKWLAELRRINATTYTDEQRAMQILESPAMLLPPITALDDFESSQQQIKK